MPAYVSCRWTSPRAPYVPSVSGPAWAGCRPGRGPFPGGREPICAVTVVCGVRRLVCVSNRVSVPRRGAAPGGLAVGVLAALRHTGGVWFGWSGETSENPPSEPQVITRGKVRFATIDLEPAQFDGFYNG